MNKRKQQKDIDKLNSHLLRYADQGKWEKRRELYFNEFFTHTAEIIGEDREAFADVLMQSDYTPMVLNVLFELFITTYWDNESTSMVGDYLKARGWRESAYARRYLQALDTSEFRLWEAVSIKSGVYVDLKPFKGKGDSIRVYEKSGTREMNQWDCIAAYVIKLDDRYSFTGAILPFSPDDVQEIEPFFADYAQSIINELKEEGDFSKPGNEDQIEAEIRQRVESAAPLLLLQLWAVNLYSYLTQEFSGIKLVNKDGDDLQLITIRYTVKAEHLDTIKQVLNNAENLEVFEQDEEWIWLPEREVKNNDGPVSILGHLVVTEHRLELQVNSSQRAERGKKYITELLGELVGEPLSVFENIDLSESPSSEEPVAPLLPEEFNPDEVIKDYLDQHYQKVLDEPVAVLDHKTPRECAEKQDQHAQLIQWLKGLENSTNSTLKAPSMPNDYDFKWMWEELGLEYPSA